MYIICRTKKNKKNDASKYLIVNLHVKHRLNFNKGSKFKTAGKKTITPTPLLLCWKRALLKQIL